MLPTAKANTSPPAVDQAHWPPCPGNAGGCRSSPVNQPSPGELQPGAGSAVLEAAFLWRIQPMTFSQPSSTPASLSFSFISIYF